MSTHQEKDTPSQVNEDGEGEEDKGEHQCDEPPIVDIDTDMTAVTDGDGDGDRGGDVATDTELR